MKIKIILPIILLMAVCAAHADSPNGFAFLKISPDVRCGAMGDAGVVLGDASAGSYYNPALLGAEGSNGVTFAHNNWIVDTKVNFLEAHFNKPYIHWGVNVLSTGVDDIEIRSTPSPEPAAVIDSRNLCLGANLAYTFYDKLSLGMGVKYVEEKIYYESSGGWLFDFGAFCNIGDYRIGASVHNIGGVSEMDYEKPQVPMTFRAGAGIVKDLGIAGEIQLGGGLNMVRDEPLRGNIGMEWSPVDIVSFRGGYLIGYDERSYTLGVGLNYKRLGFDFAYIPFDSDLGNTNRFGFRIDF
ncbi:PorV/PorQ family protein [bacterium]|nr:PorV/PorQ family protein [bacterium]